MKKEIHVDDVVAFDDRAGAHTIGIITRISHSGTTVEVMQPSIQFRELTIDTDTIEELPILCTEYPTLRAEVMVQLYERTAKVYAELARVLRECKEENQNDHQ